ncbi:MAG: LLM class flavin-dependent oxidoreductase [Chloroflexi bacterium]|nr:LLM class flavin-dependent oxidoreductase [Chloroflexota bacterium]
MRVGLRAEIRRDLGDGWETALEKVRVAEDLGFELAAARAGHAAIPWAAAIATRTSRITVATALVDCWGTSPATYAEQFALLDHLSGGRMLFGLGSTSPYVSEHLHGTPYRRALRRLREYVEIFRMLLRGERLHYRGEIFELSRGFRISVPPLRSEIPVFIGAIRPASIRQTGEIADGIFAIHWPRERLPALREMLAAGAAAAGRSPAELTLAPNANVFVLDGRDDERAWLDARRPLEHYTNRMGDFYRRTFIEHGFGAEVEASSRAWAERDREGALLAISERMVRSVQVIGTLQEVREQLRERARLGADLQMLYVPPGTPSEAGRFWEALLR